AQIERIATLEADRDEWRHRALLAEKDVRRLEERCELLTRQNDDTLRRITHQRDYYRQTVADIRATYMAGANLFNEGVKRIDEFVPRPVISLKAVADEIDKITHQPAAEEPKPAVEEPVQSVAAEIDKLARDSGQEETSPRPDNQLP